MHKNVAMVQYCNKLQYCTPQLVWQPLLVASLLWLHLAATRSSDGSCFCAQLLPAAACTPVPATTMPPMGFDQVGKVMGEDMAATRTSKTATPRAFCDLLRGKTVVFDLSALLYSLLLRKQGLTHYILSVCPTSSVYFEVFRVLSTWFRSQLLFHAKAVVFVFDPKYARGGFHCDACHDVYKVSHHRAPEEAGQVCGGVCQVGSCCQDLPRCTGSPERLCGRQECAGGEAEERFPSLPQAHEHQHGHFA